MSRCARSTYRNAPTSANTVRVVDPSIADAFRRACRNGDAAQAARSLLRIDDPEVEALLSGIGGRQAMVRFLIGRRHVLDAEEPRSLASWLSRELVEAEPMHVLNVAEALGAARRAGHEAISRRLEAHLKFVQPPDPTRWSRKLNSEGRTAFLRACERGDVRRVHDALAGDPEAVHTMDKLGRDGAALACGSDRGPEVLAILCEAGLTKTADPVVSAARCGATSMVEALLRRGFPVHRPIDESALWTAAAATRFGELGHFAQIANMLTDAGADPTVCDRWGTTAWGIASEAARPLLEALGAEPRPEGDARYDASSGCSAPLAALVRGDAIDPAGDLDLNEAAALGDVARVRHLLDAIYRLRPMIRANGSPERPLHMAAYFGQVDVAWLLLTEYGYSPGEVSAPLGDGRHLGPAETWNKTALEVAASRGHTRLVDVLMNSVDWFQGRRARRK